MREGLEVPSSCAKDFLINKNFEAEAYQDTMATFCDYSMVQDIHDLFW